MMMDDDDDIKAPGEVTIKLTRREDGGYSYAADDANDGFAVGGGAENAKGMLEEFEKLLEIIEDRSAGGSGFL
jgi:hypothetical protein